MLQEKSQKVSVFPSQRPQKAPFHPSFRHFSPFNLSLFTSHLSPSQPHSEAIFFPKPHPRTRFKRSFHFNFSFLPIPTIPISSPLRAEMRGCQWHPSTALRLAPGVRLLLCTKSGTTKGQVRDNSGNMNVNFNLKPIHRA